MLIISSSLIVTFLVFLSFYLINNNTDEKILLYSKCLLCILLWVVFYFSVVFGYTSFLITFIFFYIVSSLFFRLKRRKDMKPSIEGFSSSLEILVSVLNMILSLVFSFILKGDLWRSPVVSKGLIDSYYYLFLVGIGSIVLLVMLMYFSRFSKKLLVLLNGENLGDYYSYNLMIKIFLVIFYLLSLFPTVLLIDNYFI